MVSPKDKAAPASDCTLRDYFAANASEEDVQYYYGVLMRGGAGLSLPRDWRQLCRYMHADAMLEARKRK